MDGCAASAPSKSSTNSNVHEDVRWDDIELPDGENLRLHVFLDRSVVEVFANGQACVTDRIYPTMDDSLGLDLFFRGGSGRLESLDVWKIRPIWERRT